MSGESFNRHGHTVFAMITTKAAPEWPGDVVLSMGAGNITRLLREWS